MKFRRLCFLLTLLVCAGRAHANSDALLARLQPQGYVSDFAGVFPAAQRAALETFLTDLERQTGVEIAVVAVPSLEGGEVDDFTNRLFQKWRIGKKGKDNGVMILAAIQDRKARIEVGYGLESVLPDAAAGRILREQMFPLFKQGRYADGLTAAVQAVTEAVARPVGVQLSGLRPINQASSQALVSRSPREIMVLIRIIFLLIFFLGSFLFRRILWAHDKRAYRSLPYWGGGFSSGSVSNGRFSGGGFSSGGFSGFGGGGSGGGGASGGW